MKTKVGRPLLMKRFSPVLALLCSFCFAGWFSTPAAESTATRYLDYDGDLNRTIAIALTLEDAAPDTPLRGYYFY